MLSFVFPFTSMIMLKMFSNTFFSICMKAPKKYFALPSCGLNENQETSANRIGNQT